MNYLDRLPSKSFHAGTFNCDPNDLDNNIVTVILIEQKKLVSCISKSYYLKLK